MVVPGGMTERPNVPVLKTGVGLPTVGSNPTPSAKCGDRIDSTQHQMNGPTRGRDEAVESADMLSIELTASAIEEKFPLRVMRTPPNRLARSHIFCVRPRHDPFNGTDYLMTSFIHEDARLAALYDPLEGNRRDLNLYIEIVQRAWSPFGGRRWVRHWDARLSARGPRN